MANTNPCRFYLHKFQSEIESGINLLQKDKIVPRLWKKDYTIWNDDPNEIINRLGWLDTPDVMMKSVAEINQFVQEIQAEGYTKVVLLGMGGSSLAPEVFRKTFGVKEGFLDLHVLDSTHPEAVMNIHQQCDPRKTLYIVSTKSGGTVETLSFMKYFYHFLSIALGDDNAGRHFTAITDPGSGLEKKASDLNFRKIFLNDPEIGGRYSALSYFGLVPAALVGIDIQLLLDKASQSSQENRNNLESGIAGDAARVGVIMGLLAQKNIDKLTFIMSSEIEHFGAWVEQLIAESTGKEGKGILPVYGEDAIDAHQYRDDRLFVNLKLVDDRTNDKHVAELISRGFPVIQMECKDLYDLGSQFFVWEFATAIAGWVLQINPFDQPNVESAKIRAKKIVEIYKDEGKLPESTPVLQESGLSLFGEVKGNSLEEVIMDFLKPVDEKMIADVPGSYICLQPYLAPTKELEEQLMNLRTALQQKYQIAVTLGYGPRFLHSTGQLHKGDAGKGLFIQLSSEIQNDIDIPDDAQSDKSFMSFGVLITAQYLGDFDALKDSGRKVLRIHLDSAPKKNMEYISSLIK